MSIVENITNPFYIDDIGDRIDCMVKFDSLNEAIPFTANKHDVEAHGRAIYDALIAGQFGPVAPYVPPPAPPSKTAQSGPTVVA